MRQESGKIKFNFLKWVLVFLLFSPAPSRAEDVKLFPFPLMETEKALVDWLRHKGFQVGRSSSVSGELELSAIKNKEKWEIFCRPYSPLASLVRGRYIKDGQDDQKKLQELWFFLETYGQASPSENKRQLTYPQSIFSILSAAVVCFQARAGDAPFQFSGFIINEKGLIISTAHDLENIKDLKVILKNKDELPAKLIRKDDQRDLSLLKVNGQFKNYVLWQEGRKNLQLGEKVFMISCANRDEGEFISGVIEEILRQKNKIPLWQVSMETLPGASGSPVFDRYGNLIGIVKGRLKGTDNVGFLIPLITLNDFLRESSWK